MVTRERAGRLRPRADAVNRRTTDDVLRCARLSASLVARQVFELCVASAHFRFLYTANLKYLNERANYPSIMIHIYTRNICIYYIIIVIIYYYCIHIIPTYLLIIIMVIICTPYIRYHRVGQPANVAALLSARVLSTNDFNFGLLYTNHRVHGDFFLT
jgi:hypothetical protein